MKNIEYIRKEKGISLVDIADCLHLKSQTVREKSVEILILNSEKR